MCSIMWRCIIGSIEAILHLVKLKLKLKVNYFES